MHKIFYLYPPFTIWVGYHLATTIGEGKTWLIILSSFSCLFITTATILVYRYFYYKGKIDAYKEQVEDLRKIKGKLVELEKSKR